MTKCEWVQEDGIKKIVNELNVMKDLKVGDVEEEWQCLKNAVVSCVEQMCGMEWVGGDVRKGSEQWCEVSVAAQRKINAFGVGAKEE